MKLPLQLKLKRQLHRDIAKAHDLLVKELYIAFDKAVLHGGTAIWRCYHGNRFSEDLDVYIPRDIKRINDFFEGLKKKSFIVRKKRIKENSLFSELQLDRIIVRFEALFKKSGGILKEYEKADGNLITVYTLAPEALLKEKIEAYLNRFKIRDLYDIFFLLRYVEDRNKVSKELKNLVRRFKRPVDEKELKILIIEGLVPDTEKMLEYIKRGLK